MKNRNLAYICEILISFFVVLVSLPVCVIFNDLVTIFAEDCFGRNYDAISNIVSQVASVFCFLLLMGLMRFIYTLYARCEISDVITPVDRTKLLIAQFMFVSAGCIMVYVFMRYGIIEEEAWSVDRVMFLLMGCYGIAYLLGFILSPDLTIQKAMKKEETPDQSTLPKWVFRGAVLVDLLMMIIPFRFSQFAWIIIAGISGIIVGSIVIPILPAFFHGKCKEGADHERRGH